MDNSESIIPSSVLACVANAVSKITQSLNEGYSSVTDAAFARRLEKALEKNLNYIKRIDNQLLNPSGKVLVPPPPRPPTFMGKPPNRLGIGAQTANATNITVPPETGKRSHNGQLITSVGSEPVSVYVSNLPVDITEEELEILFGALGKIKKVKLYTTPLGHRKGDALVTFVAPEFASTACHKFNGLDIGEGHVISVVKAEFNGNKASIVGPDGEKCAKRSNNNALILADSQPVVFHSSLSNPVCEVTANITEKLTAMCKVLPPDSEASLYPVTLILNTFDPQRAQLESEAEFFDELEADMLLECCKFGKVRGIQLLNLPTSCLSVLRECMSIGSPAQQELIADLSASTAGAIAVTFALSSSAEQCAAVMGKRKFDGRQLITYVLPPLPPLPPQQNNHNPDTGCGNDSSTTNQTVSVTPQGSSNYGSIMTDSVEQTVDVEGISSNVDDFLNSLL